jgi:hypothetical protein
LRTRAGARGLRVRVPRFFRVAMGLLLLRSAALSCGEA